MEILSEILKKLYGLSEDQANVLIYADDKKETLKEIVHSKKAQKLRHSFKDNIIPSTCKNCSLYVPKK